MRTIEIDLKTLNEAQLLSILDDYKKCPSKDEDASRMAREVAYRLALISPQANKSVSRLAFEHLFSGMKIDFLEGDLTKEDFVSGQFMIDYNDETNHIVVSPIYYKNYYSFFVALQSEFLDKYSHDKHHRTLDTDIPDAVYAPLNTYLYWVSKLYVSILKLPIADRNKLLPTLRIGKVEDPCDLFDIMRQLLERHVPADINDTIESCFDTLTSKLLRLLEDDNIKNILISFPLDTRDYREKLVPRKIKIKNSRSVLLSKVDVLDRQFLLNEINEFDDLEDEQRAKNIALLYRMEPSERLKLKNLSNFVFQIESEVKVRKFLEALLGAKLDFLPHVGEEITNAVFAIKICSRYEFLEKKLKPLTKKLNYFLTEHEIVNTNVETYENDYVNLRQLGEPYCNKIQKYKQRMSKYLMSGQISIQDKTELSRFLALMHRLPGMDSESLFKTYSDQIFKLVATGPDLTQLLSAFRVGSVIQFRIVDLYSKRLPSLITNENDLVSLLRSIDTPFPYVYRSLHHNTSLQAISLKASVIESMGLCLPKVIKSYEKFEVILSSLLSCLEPLDAQYHDLSKKFFEYIGSALNGIITDQQSFTKLMSQRSTRFYAGIILEHLDDYKLRQLVPDYDALRHMVYDQSNAFSKSIGMKLINRLLPENTYHYIPTLKALNALLIFIGKDESNIFPINCREFLRILVINSEDLSTQNDMTMILSHFYNLRFFDLSELLLEKYSQKLPDLIPDFYNLALMIRVAGPLQSYSSFSLALNKYLSNGRLIRQFFGPLSSKPYIVAPLAEENFEHFASLVTTFNDLILLLSDLISPKKLPNGRFVISDTIDTIETMALKRRFIVKLSNKIPSLITDLDQIGELLKVIVTNCEPSHPNVLEVGKLFLNMISKDMDKLVPSKHQLAEFLAPSNIQRFSLDVIENISGQRLRQLLPNDDDLLSLFEGNNFESYAHELLNKIIIKTIGDDIRPYFSSIDNYLALLSITNEEGGKKLIDMLGSELRNHIIDINDLEELMSSSCGIQNRSLILFNLGFSLQNIIKTKSELVSLIDLFEKTEENLLISPLLYHLWSNLHHIIQSHADLTDVLKSLLSDIDLMYFTQCFEKFVNDEESLVNLFESLSEEKSTHLLKRLIEGSEKLHIPPFSNLQTLISVLSVLDEKLQVCLIDCLGKNAMRLVADLDKLELVCTVLKDEEFKEEFRKRITQYRENLQHVPLNSLVIYTRTRDVYEAIDEIENLLSSQNTSPTKKMKME